jgi:hypothetical protein
MYICGMALPIRLLPDVGYLYVTGHHFLDLLLAYLPCPGCSATLYLISMLNGLAADPYLVCNFQWFVAHNVSMRPTQYETQYETYETYPV